MKDATEPKSNLLTPAKLGDESFVVDERAAVTPSEYVQSKLLLAMPAVSMPVSSLHTRRDTGRYRPA